MKAYERMRSLRAQGLSEEEAWNANAVELNRYIARTFDEKVKSVADGPCRDTLRDLLHLHLNYELLDMAYYLLEASGEVTPDIVFAGGFVGFLRSSDHELRSVLGRRDGHVYENLYKWAQESELNRTQVLPTFEKYLKPMMKEARELSKL
ncbi:Acyl-CoA oxidase [Cooperia oncophora]